MHVDEFILGISGSQFKINTSFESKGISFILEIISRIKNIGQHLVFSSQLYCSLPESIKKHTRPISREFNNDEWKSKILNKLSFILH